ARAAAAHSRPDRCVRMRRADPHGRDEPTGSQQPRPDDQRGRKNRDGEHGHHACELTTHTTSSQRPDAEPSQHFAGWTTRDNRSRSTPWPAKRRCRAPGYMPSPTCAPRSTDSAPAGIQHLFGNAFLTGNAHPTHRCGSDSRSCRNEIGNWRPRIANYARRSRSRSVNSAPPPSSAAQATRRERNRNQSSDPVDGRVGDTDHHASQQVNGTDNHRAEDNLGALRRELGLDPVRGDRPQPAARRRDTGRAAARRHAWGHPAAQNRQHPRPPGPPTTPARPTPTHPLALGRRVASIVAQYHRTLPTTPRDILSIPPKGPTRSDRKGWADQQKPHAHKPTIKITGNRARPTSVHQW